MSIWRMYILAKFITFSANDCSYTGCDKDLIMNWFYPIFLKAKATASYKNNQSWWEVMNGFFAEKYRKAFIPVVETLEVMNAQGVEHHTKDMTALQSTWAFKLKCFFMDSLQRSKPGLVPGEISRSRALTHLKQMLLLFNGKHIIWCLSNKSY